MFSAKAKEKMKLSEGKGIQKSEDLKESEIVTIKEVAKVANVSHDYNCSYIAVLNKAFTLLFAVGFFY